MIMVPFESDFHSGVDFFDFFPVIFGIVFMIIIGTIIFNAAKGVGQWSKNEQSPELSVPAIVKAKRTEVDNFHHHNHDIHHHHIHSSTSYYATFEFTSGDRVEFSLSAKEYGLLAEDDLGILTFKGTRFIRFERNKEIQNHVT